MNRDMKTNKNGHTAAEREAIKSARYRAALAAMEHAVKLDTKGEAIPHRLIDVVTSHIR